MQIYSGTISAQSIVAAAVAWTPALLPGKMLMLDAETLSGYANGADVTTWADGSAAYSNSGGSTPKYIASGAGGKPVVRFDGNDYLFYPDTTVKPFRTILIVYNDISQQSWVTPLNNGPPGQNVGFHGFENDTQLLSPQYCAGVMYSGLHRENGTQKTPSQMPRPDSMTIYSHVATDKLDLPIQYIGSDGADHTTRAITGDIAFVFVGRQALALDDLEKFEGWAAHRRGLAGALPASHTYKSAPPMLAVAPVPGVSTLVAGNFSNNFQGYMSEQDPVVGSLTPDVFGPSRPTYFITGLNGGKIDAVWNGDLTSFFATRPNLYIDGVAHPVSFTYDANNLRTSVSFPRANNFVVGQSYALSWSTS